MEAIILAGGMGTRLQSMVSDVPKCMAPVAGKPFLYYLLNQLEEAGFEHIILSLGYKHEMIERWTRSYQTTLKISTAIEECPLGTGGAIKYTLAKAQQPEVFILNGDTFFNVSYKDMLQQHLKTRAVTTLALKGMHDFDRYGIVETESHSMQITAFREKRYCQTGLINGGIYLINKDALDGYSEKFSLEKDYFEKVVSTGILSGYQSSGYFIDIGIPDDYLKAQVDFKNGTYKTL